LLIMLLACAGMSHNALAQTAVTTVPPRTAVAVVPVTAPAVTPMTPSAMAPTAATLVAGDVLKITVYGNEDLTTVTRILPDGTITFPLIGQVAVGGLTPSAAEQRIAGKLRGGGFVRNAAVGIFVQERSAVPTSSVTLLGQVVNSGTYSLDPASVEGVTTLVALLAKAGGTTEKAADYCHLIRSENGVPRKVRVDLADLVRNGNIQANVPLANGDIVLVPEMDVYYIYGEVQRPGRYKLERDMTVMQGLSVASGLTARGSVKGIVLNRQSGASIRATDASLEARLQPNDVVYVKTAVF
jgi:polysaccharide export outer membrane protein